MPTGGTDFLVAAGLDAATAATVAAGVGTAFESAGIGAGLGGVLGAVEGGGTKGFLKGAESGGLTGLGVGAGGAIGGAFGGLGGISGATLGDVAGGALGGAAGGAATGGNIGLGALEGGAGGLISSQIGGTSDSSGISNPAGASTTGLPSTAPAAVPGGGTVSAAGSAAPAGVGGGGADVTSLFNSAGQDAIGGNTSLSSVGGQVGSSASSPLSTNVGAGTTGTQSLSVPDAGVGNSNFATNTASANAAGLNFSNPAADVASAGSGISNATGGATDSAGLSAGAKPPSSLSTFLAHPSFANAGNILASNPGADIAALGLGFDAVKGNQALKGENNLKAIAGQEQAQGALMENYLQTGTLPPGLQAGLDQASQAAEASIKSQYAARGMSGSSAEAQDLANLQETVSGQGAQMALQLLQSGINETGMASTLYSQIMNTALEQDKNLGSAISSFASAAAGGGIGTQGIRLVAG